MMMMNLMQPNAFTAQVFETMRLKYYLATSIIRDDLTALAKLLKCQGMAQYAHLILEESVNIPGHGSEAPLNRAARLGHIRCTELLVVHLIGIKVALTDSAITRILENALYASSSVCISASCQQEIMNVLSVLGSIDVHVLRASLLKAVICDNDESSELLLQTKPDIDVPEISSLNDVLIESSEKSLDIWKSYSSIYHCSLDADTFRHSLDLACRNGATKFVSASLEKAGGAASQHISSQSNYNPIRHVLAHYHDENHIIIRLLLKHVDKMTTDSWKQDPPMAKSLLALALEIDDSESFQLLYCWLKDRPYESTNYSGLSIHRRWLSEALTINSQLCNLKSANCLQLLLRNLEQTVCIYDVDQLLEMVAMQRNYLLTRKLLEYRYELCVAQNQFPATSMQLSQDVFVAGCGKDQLVYPDGADMKCIVEYFRFGYQVTSFTRMLEQFVYLKLAMVPRPYQTHLVQVFSEEKRKHLVLFINLFYQSASAFRNEQIRKGLFQYYTEQFVDMTEKDYIKEVCSIGWDFVYQPVSLMASCRDVVRNCNRKPFHPSWLNSLNLPYGVTKYLDFGDLEAIVCDIQKIDRVAYLALFDNW